MARTLRPLSLSQLLDETFNIYRHNFLLFIGISALPNLALLLLQLVLAELAVSGAAEIGITVFAGLVTIFAGLFVSSIVTAATTFGVSDIYLDTPTSMVACFSRVAGKALKVVLVSIIVALIIGLGSMLCLVPGIYFAGKYGIAIPAIVLEDITASESLQRSADLTKEAVGRVILVYFLTTIFTLIMVFALDAAVGTLGYVAFHNTGIFSKEAFNDVITTLGSILFGPVTAIALTLVYYDQRVRKEAFDIEHMMSLMNPPEPLASGSTAS